MLHYPLTFRRFYLFSALPIFFNENTKNKHFPFFPFNLKSALPFFNMKTEVLLHFHFFSTLTLSRRYLFSSMEIQVLLHFHIFFNFNLISALPILIDEHTKHFLHLLDHKIASYLFSLYLGTNSLQFPFFSTLILSPLNLIPRTHMKLLH